MKKPNASVRIKVESIQLLEAMLCELVETYLELFTKQRRPPQTYFTVTSIHQKSNTGEAEIGSVGEHPIKE